MHSWSNLVFCFFPSEDFVNVVIAQKSGSSVFAQLFPQPKNRLFPSWKTYFLRHLRWDAAVVRPAFPPSEEQCWGVFRVHCRPSPKSGWLAAFLIDQFLPRGNSRSSWNSLRRPDSRRSAELRDWSMPVREKHPLEPSLAIHSQDHMDEPQFNKTSTYIHSTIGYIT